MKKQEKHQISSISVNVVPFFSQFLEINGVQSVKVQEKTRENQISPIVMSPVFHCFDSIIDNKCIRVNLIIPIRTSLIKRKKKKTIDRLILIFT